MKENFLVWASGGIIATIVFNPLVINGINSLFIELGGPSRIDYYGRPTFSMILLVWILFGILWWVILQFLVSVSWIFILFIFIWSSSLLFFTVFPYPFALIFWALFSFAILD